MVPFDGPVHVLDDALGCERPAALDVSEHGDGAAGAARRVEVLGPMIRHQGAAEVSPAAPVDVDLPDGGREGLALVEIPDMLVGAVRVEYGLPGPSAPDMRHDGDGFAGFRGKARGGDDGLVQ